MTIFFPTYESHKESLYSLLLQQRLKQKLFECAKTEPTKCKFDEVGNQAYRLYHITQFWCFYKNYEQFFPNNVLPDVITPTDFTAQCKQGLSTQTKASAIITFLNKTPPNGLIYLKEIFIKHKEWMDVVTRTSQAILWFYVPNMRHGDALFSSIVKVNVDLFRLLSCKQSKNVTFGRKLDSHTKGRFGVMG